MNIKLDAPYASLSPHIRDEIVEALKKVLGKKTSKPRKATRQHAYHTVTMHNHITCNLCKKNHDDVYPFDILMRGVPQDFYEKQSNVLFCQYCAEELMKIEKEELIRRFISYLRGLSLSVR